MARLGSETVIVLMLRISGVTKCLMEQTAKDRSLRVSAQQPRSSETQLVGVRRRFAALKI